MPELPDVAIYVERLERLLAGRQVENVVIHNPFVLRTVTPPVSALAGQRVGGTRRIGKRIVLATEGGLFIVFHLMIAGR
ncbi:MAG TPA: DNA-formamidopyrimidine glycosylase family protein, partial [Gemmatimonadaceae bacterium]|nr:DNA-formamidopyrimidine glycosylase family protein [Gemmatimonadaceae bacterium]